MWVTITDSEATLQYEKTTGEIEFVTIDDGRSWTVWDARRSGFAASPRRLPINLIE